MTEAPPRDAGWDSYYVKPIPLRHYVLVVVDRWRLVVAVVVAFMVFALLSSSGPAERYEARTRLQVVVPSLSQEMLSGMGTAGSLFLQVIEDADLRHASGDPWSVEDLARTVEVQVGTPGGGSLPFLTMTAQSNDSQLAQRIADTWARAFVAEYSRLSELTVLRSNYEEFFVQLQLKRAQLIEQQSRLASLRESLSAETPLLELEQTISNDVLVLLLAGNPSGIDVSDFPDLVSATEEQNEFYSILKREAVLTQSAVDALTAEIVYLEEQVREMEPLLDGSVQLGQQIFRGAGSIQMVEAAVVPSEPLPGGKFRILLLAGFLGLLVGIAAAFIQRFAVDVREERKAERSASDHSVAPEPGRTE